MFVPVVGLSLVMALVTLTGLLPIPRMGESDLNADACFSCPNNPALCYPQCSPCPTPTITAHTPSVQGGFRQTWLNWSWTGGDTDTPWMQWYVTSGNYLNGPEISVSGASASVNLNALQAGTTYTYYMGVNSQGSDCYLSSASHEGTFTTNNAPTTEFIGWVDNESESVYHLDPLGSSIRGALVDIWANCDGLQIPFGGFTTNATGYFALQGFPMQDGAYYLDSNGECNYGQGGTPNSEYTLTVSKNGYWNVTEVVSSTLSATNDYLQFVLPFNSLDNSPLAVSFIHTVYSGVQEYSAECGFSFEGTQSQQTVQQTSYSLNTNFFGFSQQSSDTTGSQKGEQFAEPGSWGNTTGMELGYYFSGFEWENNLTVANAYQVSGEEGVDPVAFTSTDWLTAPAPLPTPMPTGYQFEVAPSQYPRSNPLPIEVFGGGTFASTTNDQIGVQVSLQWDGLSATPSAGLTYTTTVTTQSSYVETCDFAYIADPSGHGGAPYYYWYNEDSGAASSVLHVWLEGWCNNNQNPNNPEPACP